jgi:NAD(P)-dependent dehydrogenase (short-subunit alcohol dehydrogenase family)
MKQPLALIAGDGGVLGRALRQEFSDAGFDVHGLRRTPMGETGTGHGDAPTLTQHDCDLSDAQQAHDVVSRIGRQHGAIDTLVYNPAVLSMAPFAQLSLADFESAWRTSVLGAMACAQAVLPAMLQRGHGTLIFTGATASMRGTSGFAAFASAKFALRGLAQSLAREYQPHGIHVVHVVLDGLLQGSASIQRFGGNDAQAMDCAEVARTYRWLSQQPASTWTHELDMRPATGRF